MNFKNYIILVICTALSFSSAVSQGLNPQKFHKIISLPFDQKGYPVPANTTIQLNFEFKNLVNQDTKYFLNIGDEQLGILYEIKNGSQVLIGKAGARVPIPKRSIVNDVSTIEINFKKNELKKLELHIQNVFPNTKIVKLELLDGYAYQQKVQALKSTFYTKYWTPAYFGILLLVILLTAIQYFVLPEKVFVYYFFYLLFTFIRSAAANEFLVLENWFPFLNNLNYSSQYSQVFTYLSFIFYVLFLRQFTGFPAKMPRLDYFYKIQITYLIGFIIFDLLFTTTKYTNPQINTVFRSLEFIGLVIGAINLLLLFKVYDSFNKYILVGAFSLFFVAIFGQEIYKRMVDETLAPASYRTGLAIIWSSGYMVEIFFFTLALISRQRNLLKAISFEQEKNKALAHQLEAKNEINIIEEPIDFDSFTLATNRGVLVFQQSEIVRLEASGNYTIFTIHNNNQTLGSYTLADFEQKLNPAKFLRVHKSHVVNLQYVVKYKKGDGGTLTLQDGSEIPVSRSRKEELIKRLNF